MITNSYIIELRPTQQEGNKAWYYKPNQMSGAKKHWTKKKKKDQKTAWKSPKCISLCDVKTLFRFHLLLSLLSVTHLFLLNWSHALLATFLCRYPTALKSPTFWILPVNPHSTITTSCYGLWRPLYSGTTLASIAFLS